MMRIGIVTIYDNHNFGNKLQNYAMLSLLEHYMREKGEEVVCTTLVRQQEEHKKIWKEILKRILVFIGSKKYREYFAIQQKERKAEEFSGIHLNPRKIKETDKLADEFDFIVTGSDQVWNYKWYTKEQIKFFLLDFVPEGKRVAIAPSFGVDSLESDIKLFFKSELEKFSFLSVREEKGKEILQELTGKGVNVLLDPTLVLSRKEWDVIREKSAAKSHEKYILGYFLGDLKQEDIELIQKLKNRYQLSFINLMDYEQRDSYVISPGEFVDYIAGAELVCTDSYHGTIFSVIYEVPVVIWERDGKVKDINSRLETLSHKLGLKERFLGHLDFDKIMKMDFERIKNNLEKEKKYFLKQIESIKANYTER